MCGVSFAPAGVATVTVMLSYLHEGLVELFRYRPTLATEMLADLLGVSVPSFDEARVASSDLTNLVPTEYRADTVITLTLGDAPVLGLVVEVQLRDDPQKRWAWPAYVVNLYARLRRPVLLLVMSPDPAAAVWCGTPIVVGGPGLTLRPLVLGPSNVPVVTDPELARRQPELAVLSAVAHGKRHG